MGNIGSSLGNIFGGVTGSAGGVQGTGRTLNTANLTQPTNANQIQGAYGANQNALQQQQALLQALQNQNYAGYQRNALNGLQNIAGSATAVNGFGNQQASLQALQGLAGQQQGTLQQYQNLANGVGPNPAQAMLAQQTGQNVANQSAMMAGQRGASQNVGLIGRQAAQQGAATQQQAVGQGATLQAQQQLQGLQGLTAQQQAIGQTRQAAANIGAQQIAQQQAAQQAYSNQANQLLGQQIGATTGQTQAQQSEQQILQNALGQYNTQQAGMQNTLNSANAGIAQTNIQGQQALMGGALNGIGGALGSLAEGGEVKKPKKMAAGGDPSIQTPMQPMPNTSGPQSSIGKFLQGWTEGQGVDNGNMIPTSQDVSSNPGASKLQQGSSKLTGGLLKGFGNSTTPSAAGAYAGPDIGGAAGASAAGSGAAGGAGAAGIISDLGPAAVLAASKGGLAKKGGHVKASSSSQKAVKKGDDYANDKIPAYLSEGEIVIPRSVTKGKDPIRGSADFVRKVLAKKKRA